jgi:spore maturation protein SpmB
VPVVDLVMTAGRSAVELALFVLLPIMVVMLAVMRLLEACSVLDRLALWLTPVLRPFGLTGLSVFALLQVSFVGFAAPIATLGTMERRGACDRHLAASFAMVLAMGQANVAFPMAAIGLDLPRFLAISVLGGLVAAAATFHLLTRHWPGDGVDPGPPPAHPGVNDPKGPLAIVNQAGAEAFRIATGSIPMVALSLVAIALLRAAGGVDALQWLLSPLLRGLGIDPRLVLPSISKYLGGGSAALATLIDLQRAGGIDARFVNASAGWLVHPFDLPGVAVLVSAGPRVARLWKTAALGALAGILARSVVHMALWPG